MEFTVIEHIWVPTRDGTRLSARLWLPESDDPVAAVLEYIPYRKRDAYRMVDSAWGPVLAHEGFAFARVDVRGSGESEGIIGDEYTPTELADGEDVIAWLARQDWCSGKVGMRGISWGGINTLQIAARRPPALKAIMPMACTDNRFTDDAHYIGGALGRTNFQWGTLFKTVLAGPPDPEIVGADWQTMWQARLAATPPILSTWTEHQCFDTYWQQGSLADNHTAIEVPTYLVAGWQDTYANPVCRLFSKLAAPKKALIGPWGHTYPQFAATPGLDWAAEEVRWWRHWLAGEETGIMAEPAVKVFVPYETARQAGPRAVKGRWRTSDTWPPQHAVQSDFYLHKHTLVDAPPPQALFTVDAGKVVGTTKREWLDALPIEQSHDDALSVVFDSPALQSDMEISGSPVAHLQLAANQPVAHVAVRLCEVTPDGRSWLVSYGLRNLTHRHGHVKPTPLQPGEVFELELPLHAIAHRLQKGSCIRIALSESLWPLVWPSPGAAQLTVQTGNSRVSLPVTASNGETLAPTALAGAGHVESEPFAYAPAIPDADGDISITHEVTDTPTHITDTGTRLSRSAISEARIVEGDPRSCEWREQTRSTWQRNEWDCAVEAELRLTADDDTFTLIESLRAYKNAELIFERTHNKRIRRNLL